MLTDEQITRSLQSAGCAGVVRMSFESGPYCIDRPTIKASRFAEQIESAATAPLLARIAELERELEEARKDEREHWENACRLMLVARSGQITDMALAERLVGLISEDRKEKQAIRAAIKEQT